MVREKKTVLELELEWASALVSPLELATAMVLLFSELSRVYFSHFLRKLESGS